MDRGDAGDVACRRRGPPRGPARRVVHGRDGSRPLQPSRTDGGRASSAYVRWPSGTRRHASGWYTGATPSASTASTCRASARRRARGSPRASAAPRLLAQRRGRRQSASATVARLVAAHDSGARVVLGLVSRAAASVAARCAEPDGRAEHPGIVRHHALRIGAVTARADQTCACDASAGTGVRCAGSSAVTLDRLRRSGARRPVPRASELEASRLAPCTPEQATSPQRDTGRAARTGRSGRWRRHRTRSGRPGRPGSAR